MWIAVQQTKDTGRRLKTAIERSEPRAQAVITAWCDTMKGRYKARISHVANRRVEVKFPKSAKREDLILYHYRRR